MPVKWVWVDHQWPGLGVHSSRRGLWWLPELQDCWWGMELITSGWKCQSICLESAGHHKSRKVSEQRTWKRRQEEFVYWVRWQSTCIQQRARWSKPLSFQWQTSPQRVLFTLPKPFRLWHSLLTATSRWGTGSRKFDAFYLLHQNFFPSVVVRELGISKVVNLSTCISPKRIFARLLWTNSGRLE